MESKIITVSRYIYNSIVKLITPKKQQHLKLLLFMIIIMILILIIHDNHNR